LVSVRKLSKTKSTRTKNEASKRFFFFFFFSVLFLMLFSCLLLQLKALIKALRAEIEEWKTYANKLKSGQVGAEAPKGGVVVADIVEAKRRDDALEAELERAREAAATAQQQMQELAAELESVVAQREAALAAANAAQTQIDSDRRAHLVQEQHFSSQVEALQMQLRLANASGGDSSSSSSSSKSDSSAQFVAELTTVTEKLNDAKAKLVESSEERRIMLKQHEDALQLEKAKREQMESEMAALQDKIRQLEAWRDSQETRKARLFRPLKSGTKGPPQAFAEKLDHTELRKGLRSVSAEKKLW
jgi:chromosome segregation ATPase